MAPPSFAMLVGAGAPLSGLRQVTSMLRVESVKNKYRFFNAF
jgi:hypothetical protein